MRAFRELREVVRNGGRKKNNLNSICIQYVGIIMRYYIDLIFSFLMILLMKIWELFLLINLLITSLGIFLYISFFNNNFIVLKQ